LTIPSQSLSPNAPAAAVDDPVAVGAPTTLDLALFERASDEQIEEYIAELPRDRVIGALHLINKIRKALQVAEKMAASRADAEQILGVGEVWTAPDGTEFMWSGDRHREVTDAEGLKNALTIAAQNGMLPMLAARALKGAFKTEIKTYLLEIDRIVKFAPDIADIVREFTVWKSGPNKLRPLDEGGRDR
jgi:hypothetical protein